MKKFMVWLIVAFTLAFLTGVIYWTNLIEGILGLEWDSGGYFVYQMIMLAVAVGMIIFFRKQKWV